MSFLRGLGAWVPERVVTNAELAAEFACDAEWIFTASGIRERRYSEASDTVASLGVRAARACLERCGIEAGRVGLVIAASGTGERRFPGPAAEIATALGIAGTPAIDLPMASAGSVFGLALASQLAPAYGEVLVVAAEKMSAAVSEAPRDRNTAILFGDGAGAALVSREAGVAEFGPAVLHSDGAFANELRLERAGNLQMNGQVVILQSSRKIPAGIREALEAAGVAAGDVAVFLMHQANKNLIVRVAQAVGVGAETFYSNIEKYGNTSSASMLIAASEWWGAGGLRVGECAVFAGFGAGFHWGAVTVRGC